MTEIRSTDVAVAATDSARSLERYFEAASGRAGFALWGKARPADSASAVAHPLICHVIDVAVVAEQLVDEVLAKGTVARLFENFGCSAAAARMWLPLIVALHDCGKATPAFQGKWVEGRAHLKAFGFDLNADGARDHGTVGPFFLAPVFESFGIDATGAYRLARAVCAHHGSFPTDAAVPDDRRGVPVSQAIGLDERGRLPIWQLARAELIKSLASVFPLAPEVPSFAESGSREQWAFFSYLAGLTSVADWIGSMAEFFVYEDPPVDLSAYLARSRLRARQALNNVGLRPASATRAAGFEELFGRTPRPLQVLVTELVEKKKPPLCAIVEAPMGEGKTEAAFYFAHALAARGHHDGLYVALPTQATANQMFSRLLSFLERTRTDKTSAILVHGEASFDTRMRDLMRAVYGGSGDDGVGCEGWFLGKKRSLIAPFGAGTIDQALLAVLRTKHSFVRQFGLAGKTVILDEVHAYDAYTSKLLDRLVGWLGAHGTSVILLSATLPSSRRKALLDAYAGRTLPDITPVKYPRVTTVDRDGFQAYALTAGRDAQRMELTWLEDEPLDALSNLVVELGTSLAGGGCLAILRNTVNRAQRTFEALRAAKQAGGLPDDTDLLLLHARFPMDERQENERLLATRLGPPGSEVSRPSRLIVVGTQVLEQSLDVDFDRMFSDLAPVDLLLQRAGRVHRHARPARPAALAVPRLVVIKPAGTADECSLTDVAIVYARYIVRRTLQELETRRTISLPDDIEPLVEAVYSATPQPMAEKLTVEWKDLCETQASETTLAKTRAWPEATITDDPFASFAVPFMEDEPDVAKALRAETRLAEESVSLLCLFGSLNEAFLDPARTMPVDLHASPSAATVRALAGRTVKVSRYEIVQALKNQPVPDAFRDVAVLRDRHPLFFGSEPLRLGLLRLDLSPALGLTIAKDLADVQGDENRVV